MPCRKIQVALILSLLCVSLEAQDIRIALFYGIEVQAAVFSTVEGEYMLSGDGRNIAVARKGSIFHIELDDARLSVHDTLQSYGEFNNLEFTGTSAANIFQIKPVFPSLPSKESDDNLSISAYNDALRMINQLNLEKYIPGTVEAEGGAVADPEYYKAQAVITRTFAVKNFHRHAHEGFNLCDGTHCQAFNGKSRMNAQIYASTRDTKDVILVDRNGEPIITAFHANCGGITASASVEWNRELPYLMPVNDLFCNESRYHNWTKSISAAEWNGYLEKTGYFAENVSLNGSTDSGRQKYLDSENKRLPLTEIRKDLKLRSSYFYVTQGTDSVTFHGHGYGHGLGLCQEGAMEMAKVGYTYLDILMFYYTRLSIAVFEAYSNRKDDQ